uniref:Small ribosomal subunit protein mS29 n=1 Tax=Alona affinis TaxID=381656 RepID=A0A9N6WNW6_9CRUS|nr:EOG090X05V1 [Alona affinis]
MESNEKAEAKFHSAMELKLEGNAFFGQQNYKEAIRRYHRALMYVKGVENDGSDLIGNMCTAFGGDEGQGNRKVNAVILEKNKELKMDCFNNLSGWLRLFLNWETMMEQCNRSAILKNIKPNQAKHGVEHEGRFYQIEKPIKKQLFTYGGLPQSFNLLSETFNELCLMVRKPAIELISYLNATNFDAPVNRYVLYGKNGTGKSMTLAHILHYVPNWFRRFKEIVPSTTSPEKFDHPFESVAWLRHFSLQNGPLLQKLNLKTTETYTWSKREITEKGVPLTELIDHGLNRGKFASGCVVAVIEELKKAATTNKEYACAFTLRKMYQFNYRFVFIFGFEHIDPFIPIEVKNYSEKEMHSQIDYYAERKWLQQPKAVTERGRAELSFSSGNNPYTLMKLVDPY